MESKVPTRSHTNFLQLPKFENSDDEEEEKGNKKTMGRKARHSKS
jgi:hypothetical protein